MSLSKEVSFKELLDPKLIFSVILIVIGLFDISHVSSYVRNYDDQFSSSLGYSIDLFEQDKELSQVDFFNAIFMLCTGFFVTIWGSFKFFLWFERREILILIEEVRK